MVPVTLLFFFDALIIVIDHGMVTSDDRYVQLFERFFELFHVDLLLSFHLFIFFTGMGQVRFDSGFFGGEHTEPLQHHIQNLPDFLLSIDVDIRRIRVMGPVTLLRTNHA